MDEHMMGTILIVVLSAARLETAAYIYLRPRHHQPDAVLRVYEEQCATIEVVQINNEAHTPTN